MRVDRLEQQKQKKNGNQYRRRRRRCTVPRVCTPSGARLPPRLALPRQIVRSFLRSVGHLLFTRYPLLLAVSLRSNPSVEPCKLSVNTVLPLRCTFRCDLDFPLLDLTRTHAKSPPRFASRLPLQSSKQGRPSQLAHRHGRRRAVHPVPLLSRSRCRHLAGPDQPLSIRRPGRRAKRTITEDYSK